MKGKKLSYKERIARLEADKNERRRIFDKLCAHVAKGYSLDCFAPISEVSIRKYLKEYPEEFIQEELDEALRKGKDTWEDIGHRQATGNCLGNSRTWFYNMSNRFGWSDKQKIEAEYSGSVAVNIVSYASQKQSE